MKPTLGIYYDHRPAHFRFARSLPDFHAVECYEPRDKLRWVAFVVAIVCSVLSVVL